MESPVAALPLNQAYMTFSTGTSLNQIVVIDQPQAIMIRIALTYREHLSIKNKYHMDNSIVIIRRSNKNMRINNNIQLLHST